MLLQITNMCHEGCEHCFQCSNPNGKHMDYDTLVKAVSFGKYIKTPVFVVSGGEPTLHPQFYDFCKYLSEHNCYFTICTNGSFVEDDVRKSEFERVIKFKGFCGAQVYNNKDFYPNYEKRAQMRSYYESLNNVVYDESAIIAMKDIGRAKTSAKAQEYVDKSIFACSCANITVLAAQSSRQSFVKNYSHHALRMMCHPMIDYKGGVHMSESWLCPAVGNVNDDTYLQIIDGMLSFRPCGKCKDYLKLSNQKYNQARLVLGI